MSGSFLCILSRTEAVFCLVRFCRSFISRAMIAWNTSPISRVFWPEHMTIKGIVMFDFVPIMPSRSFSHPPAYGA
jgi:hypothetical protein